MAIQLDEVQRLIEEALPGASVRVEDHGGGDHLFAEVRAPQFEGRSRLEQHRLVMSAVSERMEDGSIHALSLKTSPQEAPA